MKRLLLSGLMSAALFGAYAVDYCTVEGNIANNGRCTSALTITTPTGNTTIADLQQPGGAVYWDKSEIKVVANAGDEITVTPEGSGSWMHNYLFVDYNGNGDFLPSWNAETHLLNAGSELVAFSFYDPAGGDNGWNSLGEEVTSNVADPFNYPLTFTIPSDLADGDYRVRYKVDWNNIDACGVGGQGIGTNGGVLIDFTLQVGEGGEVKTDGTTVAINVTGAGKGSVKVVNANDGTEYTAGSIIPFGTFFNIEIVPEEGSYIVKAESVEDNEVWDLTSEYQNADGSITVSGWDSVSDRLTINVEFGVQAVGPDIEGNVAIRIPAVGDILTMNGTKYREEFYRLEIPNEVLFNTGASTGPTFTMSTWIRFNSFPDVTDENGSQIMGHRAHQFDNLNGSMLIMYNADHKLCLKSGAGNTNATSDFAIEAGKWYYLTLSYDAENDNTFSIYCDGELVIEKANGKAWSLFMDTDNLHPECGSMWFVGGSVTDVDVDQVEFYNKALSAAEIAKAMDKPAKVEGLVAEYDFDKPAVGTAGQFASVVEGAPNATFRKIQGGVAQGVIAVKGCSEVSPEYTAGRVILEYCTYEGNNNHGGRATTALTFTNSLGQVFEVPVEGKEIYHDLTDYVVEVFPGNTVVIKPTAVGEWMHSYAYVDFGQDGAFSYDINEDGTPVAGTDLVSFTNYNVGGHFGGSDLWVNSLGDIKNDGHSNLSDVLPEFTIPSDLAAGDYRLRFKIDWNNLDPCGTPFDSPSNTLNQNGGVMVDVTLRVNDAPTRTVTVFCNEYALGTVEFVSPESLNGMDVKTPLPVTVKATPNEGVEFVNWSSLTTGEILSTEETYTYTGAEDIYLWASFGYKLYLVENGGQMIAYGNYGTDDAVLYQNGSKVPYGNMVTVEIREPSGLQLKRVILNDEDVTDEVKYYESGIFFSFNLTETSVLEAEFGEPVYKFTADITGEGTCYVSASEDGETVDVENGQEINIEGDDCYLVAVPAEGWSLATLEIDGVELTPEDADSVIENRIIYYWATGANIKVDVVFTPDTAIELIGADAAEAEFFNLQGVRVNSDNLVPGVYLMRRGSETVKVLVK